MGAPLLLHGGGGGRISLPLLRRWPAMGALLVGIWQGPASAPPCVATGWTSWYSTTPPSFSSPAAPPSPSSSFPSPVASQSTRVLLRVSYSSGGQGWTWREVIPCAPREIPSIVHSQRRGRTTGARSSARLRRTGQLRRFARRRGSRR
jgi:hypothetical protein